jgi:hypothetical protein
MSGFESPAVNFQKLKAVTRSASVSAVCTVNRTDDFSIQITRFFNSSTMQAIFRAISSPTRSYLDEIPYNVNQEGYLESSGFVQLQRASATG